MLSGYGAGQPDTPQRAFALQALTPVGIGRRYDGLKKQAGGIDPLISSPQG